MALSLALTGTSNSESPVLLVGFESGAVGVFDLTAGRERTRAVLHSEPVLAIEVGPGGHMVATSAADSSICISRLQLGGSRGFTDAEERKRSAGLSRSEAGTPGARLEEVSEAAEEVEVDANTEAVATNADGAVLKATTRLALESPGAEALAVRAGGGILAVGCWDRRVRLFEWSAPHRPLAILQHHTAGISAVAWSANSALLASASKDTNIALWSVFPSYSE
jgi:WD40 repeat protein